LINIHSPLSPSRKVLFCLCRASILVSFLLLPVTVYTNYLSQRSDDAKADPIPSSLDLTLIDSSYPRPLGTNTNLESYKNVARLIWTVDEDAGLRLRRIVNLLYLQFDKSELINPWYQDWVAFVLSKTGLPKLRDLSSAIEPTSIAKANNAFCSQLSILLMSILRDLGVNYQALRISFDNGKGGHFVTLASASGRIFLLDPHRNPPFDISGESTLRLLSSRYTLSEFNQIYKPTGLDVKSVEIQLGDWNSFPASTSRTVRVITKNLSQFAWLYFLTFGSLGLFFVNSTIDFTILDGSVDPK
jgi:hypothetical protein